MHVTQCTTACCHPLVTLVRYHTHCRGMHSPTAPSQVARLPGGDCYGCRLHVCIYSGLSDNAVMLRHRVSYGYYSFCCSSGTPTRRHGMYAYSLQPSAQLLGRCRGIASRHHTVREQEERPRAPNPCGCIQACTCLYRALYTPTGGCIQDALLHLHTVLCC